MQDKFQFINMLSTVSKTESVLFKIIHQSIRIFTIFLFILFSTFILNCSGDTGNYNDFKVIPSDIPINQIIHGGPERDGIPAIDEPIFVEGDQTRAIQQNDLVIGVVIEDEAKAYPLNLLNWHEIVNDSVGGIPVVITYCPLCRSGLVFDATVYHPNLDDDNNVLSFGVSGLLYNNNLLFYDRETESLWSQVTGKAVTGELIGTELQYIPSVITSWGRWSTDYPDSLVMVPGENVFRDYFSNPYGDYENSKKIIFPVSRKIDDTFHPKEIVAGIILPDNQGIKAYPFSLLEKMSEVQQNSFIDQINETMVTVTWDQENQAVEIKDDQGNNLNPITMYWFSWNVFYPDSGVFKIPR